jgi:hypothetical protein
MTAFENLILRGARGDQPAASTPGRLYYVTDEQVLERDTGATWEDVSAAAVAAETDLPPLAFFGLNLSNSGADANNDIIIGVGGCRDDADTYNMKLTSALTKQLDASWGAGNNAGGLDTGAEGASTWYHVYLIRKDSDGSIDALFTATFGAPTMPGGYSTKRYVGSFRNNASSNIRPFIQTGNVVMWNDSTIALDISGSIGNTRSLVTVLVPLGLKVKGFFNFSFFKDATAYADICDPDQPDVAISGSAWPLAVIRGATNTTYAGIGVVLTNSSAQIAARASTTTCTLNLATIGWEYLRQV